MKCLEYTERLELLNEMWTQKIVQLVGQIHHFGETHPMDVVLMIAMTQMTKSLRREIGDFLPRKDDTNNT